MRFESSNRQRRRSSSTTTCRDDQRIPVFIELDEEKVASAGGAIDFSRGRIQDAIDRGLRAQLQSESILTGLLFVQLDFLPESKPDYFGLSKTIREIPTVPTTLELAQSGMRRTLDKLEKIDFDRIVTSAENTIDAIERLVDVSRAEGGARLAR